VNVTRTWKIVLLVGGASFLNVVGQSLVARNPFIAAMICCIAIVGAYIAGLYIGGTKP